jgi:hypothetical protein
MDIKHGKGIPNVCKNFKKSYCRQNRHARIYQHNLRKHDDADFFRIFRQKFFNYTAISYLAPLGSKKHVDDNKDFKKHT